MPEVVAYRKALLALIVAVAVSSVVALFAFPGPAAGGREGFFLLVLGGAVLASCRPVRVARLRVDIVLFHPFLLMALALFGIRSAVLIGVLSIITAASLRNELPPAIRVLFNLGATTLATVAAGHVALLFGLGDGTAPAEVALPLSVAALVFVLVKSALVAAAIALELGQGYARSWTRSLGWTVLPDLAGIPIALVALALVTVSPLSSVGIALAPCALLWLYYRAEGARRSGEAGTTATRAPA